MPSSICHRSLSDKEGTQNLSLNNELKRNIKRCFLSKCQILCCFVTGRVFYFKCKYEKSIFGINKWFPLRPRWFIICIWLILCLYISPLDSIWTPLLIKLITIGIIQWATPGILSSIDICSTLADLIDNNTMAMSISAFQYLPVCNNQELDKIFVFVELVVAKMKKLCLHFMTYFSKSSE